MAARKYDYQFDTNPKKLEEYEYSTKKAKSKNANKKSTKRMTNKKTKKSQNTNKKTNVVKEKVSENKLRRAIIMKVALMFAMVFVIIYQGSKVNESFNTIQNLKTQISALQKENDQLKISIQNSLNLNNIEQAAKELLGMQKLSSKQTVYITLPKKDYVEYKSEEVLIETENTGWFSSLVNSIKNLFN